MNLYAPPHEPAFSGAVCRDSCRLERVVDLLERYEVRSHHAV